MLNERDFRGSYLRGKLNVLISSQIYALRKKFFGTQTGLAKASGMKQSRISAMERPGFTKFNIETLIRLAATFKVGLVVKFVPYSEVLKWDNEFSQDTLNVKQINDDTDFLNPSEATPEPAPSYIETSYFLGQGGEDVVPKSTAIGSISGGGYRPSVTTDYSNVQHPN